MRFDRTDLRLFMDDVDAGSPTRGTRGRIPGRNARGARAAGSCRRPGDAPGAAPRCGLRADGFAGVCRQAARRGRGRAARRGGAAGGGPGRSRGGPPAARRSRVLRPVARHLADSLRRRPAEVARMLPFHPAL